MKKSTADKIARQVAKVINPETLSVASVVLAATGHLFAAWTLAMLATGLLVGAARILGKEVRAKRDAYCSQTGKQHQRGQQPVASTPMPVVARSTAPAAPPTAVLTMPEMEAIRKALNTAAWQSSDRHNIDMVTALELWNLPQSVIDWVIGR